MRETHSWQHLFTVSLLGALLTVEVLSAQSVLQRAKRAAEEAARQARERQQQQKQHDRAVRGARHEPAGDADRRCGVRTPLGQCGRLQIFCGRSRLHQLSGDRREHLHTGGGYTARHTNCARVCRLGAENDTDRTHVAGN